jgi:acyl-CoA thioesterase I
MRIMASLKLLPILFAICGVAVAKPVQVGVLENPCAALDQPPAAFAAYLAKRARAEAAKEPLPPPSAEERALYNDWQQRRLLQDFAGLCRYREANAALAPASNDRVVFFGDSITELWKNQDPDFFSKDLIDRGISGQTTTQMVARFRADVIDLHPRVVHILAGTNDIAGNTGPTTLAWIEANIRTMVELARAHHIAVVLASVPPAARFNWRPEIAPVDSILALNDWLKGYAHQVGLVYVDYFGALDDGHHALKPSLSADGVHPNAGGYAIMRPLAEQALHQATSPIASPGSAPDLND